MCPTDTAFAVPRTPLENRFLLAVLRKTNIKSIWIDLNSLKAPDCWTTGNNNCPYGDSVPPPPRITPPYFFVQPRISFDRMVLIVELTSRTESTCPHRRKYPRHYGLHVNVSREMAAVFSS